ncbi:MAG: VanW family protein [bacterium]|nr:VanW family protein [bacterium]
MITEAVIGGALALAAIFNDSTPLSINPTVPQEVQLGGTFDNLISQPLVLAEHSLDLATRLSNTEANQVFVDNILLTLRYLKGDVGDLRVDKGKLATGNIDWEKAREPFEASLTLNPGEVFAYHDAVLPGYRSLPIKTTNAHYMLKEGFKPLSGLPGNGVCHLASLINWVATDAGLEVVAKVNHDFYPVPGVPRINGTSIRYAPDGSNNSFNQNLYIKNQFDTPITFNFKADGENVVMQITK